MSGSIGAFEFDGMIEDGSAKELTLGDLGRFQFDTPKARVALLSWCGEYVDHFGEVVAAHWRIVRAGDAKRWKEFHRWGVLLFGDPPWKGSQVFQHVGGLKKGEALEDVVKALPAPSADFEYGFSKSAFDAVIAPVEVEAPAGAERGHGVVLGHDVKSRWRRASKRGVEDLELSEKRKRPKGQGELF